MDELLARLRAPLRRSNASGSARQHRELHNRLAAKQVTLADGAAVRLTPTEWHVLEILIRREGKLLAQRQLLQEVWGPAYETETNYLRVYVAQLRRNLERRPSHPRHVITDPGMGYRFARG